MEATSDCEGPTDVHGTDRRSSLTCVLLADSPVTVNVDDAVTMVTASFIERRRLPIRLRQTGVNTAACS